MQKHRILIIIAVVLGIAAAFMAKILIDQRTLQIQERAKEAVAQIQANQAVVLVAKQDLPKGTVLDNTMLETAIVPNQYVQPQAVSTLDRVSGMMVIAPFSKNEQITLSKLSSQQQGAGGGGSLAMATPIGKRAITVSVDNVSSLLGMVKPGDYVDVIALLPVPVQTADGKTVSQTEVLPLFQNVLILAVGQNTGAAAGPAGGDRYKKEAAGGAEISPYITLALAPEEASLIAFVLEQGKVRLTLRSPADSQTQAMQPAGWETLFRHVTPQKQEAEGAAEKEASGGYNIEIYRGLSKETISVK